MSKLTLSDNQKRALSKVKEAVSQKLKIDKFIVFGSVARGEADEESDMDVLILTKSPVSHKEKHDIYSIATEVNLHYDTNISLLILNKEDWENGMYSILPIKDEIRRDGVAL